MLRLMQSQLKIEVACVVRASISIGPGLAMPADVEVTVLSDDDQPVLKSKPHNSSDAVKAKATMDTEPKQKDATKSKSVSKNSSEAAKPKAATKSEKPSAKSKPAAKKAAAKAKSKTAAKGRAKAKATSKKKKAADDDAKDADASPEEAPNPVAASSLGGEDDDPGDHEDREKAMKRPSASASTQKMKKPAAAPVAYKYKYHQKSMWGVKFHGKEYCTVRDSVQQNMDIVGFFPVVSVVEILFELECR